MRYATVLFLMAFAAPAFAGPIVSVSVTDERTHPGFTAINGLATLGNNGSLQWKIPNLNFTNPGLLLTMNESNAASFGFDWDAGETYLSSSNEFTFSVGSQLGSNLGTLHSTSQVFPGGGTLQEMRFEVLTWLPNSLSFRGTVQYVSNVPEPATVWLLLAAATCSLVTRRHR